MMLNIAQLYILQIIRDKECSYDNIINQIGKLRHPPFSIHKKMMYHHIELLGKKGLIHVEKSHTLPPRLTITITDAGLQQLDSLYALIKQNNPVQIQQNSPNSQKTQLKYPKRNVDTESIAMSIESSAIELLNREYETVTDAEKARIARFTKKIIKIIEDNM